MAGIHRQHILRAGIFAVLVAPGIQAQADTLLETLMVTGRSPDAAPGLAHTLVRVESIERLPGTRIDSAELLQVLPGVQADSRSNYAQDTRITLRGFGARSAFGVRGLSLRVDGIPLTTPDGQGQLSSIPLDGIDNIDVLRGPLASLYGNGAGGVISLNTQAPEDSRISLRTLAGEGGTERQGVAAQWQKGPLALRLQGSRFKTDGDRPHAAAERQHAGAQLFYTAANGLESRLRLDLARDPLLQDPLGLTAAQWSENPNQINELAETFNTRKEVSHRQLAYSLRQPLGNSRWQLAAWGGEREILQYLGFTGAAISNAGGVVDLQRDFKGISGNYAHDLAVGDGLLTAALGTDLTRSEDRRRGYVNDGGQSGDLRRNETGEVEGRDIHGVLHYRPAGAWEVYGGLRHSRLDFSVEDWFVVPGNPDDSGRKSYDYLSSALGIRYRLTPGWAVHASLGRGFETPTLTEMAYRSEGTGLNTDLEAARNRQQEIGIRFHEPGGPEYRLVIFTVDTRNEIVVDQSLGGRTSYRNAAATERQGVEISGRAPLADAWHLWLNLNYLEADFSEGEWQGRRLPGVARHNHYLQLRWQPWLDERLMLGLGVQQRSRVATADDNLVFAPSATAADLALSSRHQWGAWELHGWLKASNLSDEAYVGSVIVNQANGRSFEPAPGRQFSAGIEVGHRW